MVQENNPGLEAVGLHDVKGLMRMCETVKNKDALFGQIGESGLLVHAHVILDR